MLISPEALKYFCYAIFYRDAAGHWFSYVRSFAPASTSDSLRVEIKIGRPGAGGSLDDDQSFVFKGRVASSEAGEQEVHDAGHYLMLSDGQVKNFQVDKTIMEYRITLRQIETSPSPCPSSSSEPGTSQPQEEIIL